MTWYTHINKHTVARNKRDGTNLPAIRFQRGKRGQPTYAHRVRFKEGEVVYRPDGPPLLPCGARLVIVTEEEPEVIE